MIQLVLTEIREFESLEQFNRYFRQFKLTAPYNNTFFYDLDKKGEAWWQAPEPGVSNKIINAKKILPSVEETIEDADKAISGGIE